MIGERAYLTAGRFPVLLRFSTSLCAFLKREDEPGRTWRRQPDNPRRKGLCRWPALAPGQGGDCQAQ
jgi:hypothetical protein